MNISLSSDTPTFAMVVLETKFLLFWTQFLVNVNISSNKHHFEHWYANFCYGGARNQILVILNSISR